MAVKNEETQAAATQIEELVKTDPQLQQLREQGNALHPSVGQGKGDTGWQHARQQINLQIADRLEQLGVPLPKDYKLNLQSGDVDFQNWWERNWDKVVATALVGVATAGIASAATAGGAGLAGGAGGGAGAGIGETGAITGLAGSGLEAGATAGGAAAAGGGAASSAALEGSAVQGITPELAGSLGADSAAGTGIAGAGSAGSILGRAAPYINKAAPILGGMAKAGADANAARDRILPSMESAQIARDKFALDAPTTRLTQSVRSSAIKNAAPVAVNWAGPGSGLKGQVPNFSGGYQNALANLDPETKQLAEATLHKDLQDQLAGKDDQSRWLDQFGKTSVQDKIVGGAATAAQLYAGVKK